MKIGPVEYLVGATGVGLLLAALGNVNPLDVVRVAVTGGNTPGRRSTLANLGADAAGPAIRPLAEPVSAVFRQFSRAGAGTTPTAPGPAGPDLGNPADKVPPLETIGQGSHKLRPEAAAAFKAWERAYGAPILVTDSYRSWSSQYANWKKDPERFSNPDNSAHPDGLAVDVDLPKTTGGADATGEPQYDRLVAAAHATGWVSYSDGKPGSHTWHFSYGTRR